MSSELEGAGAKACWFVGASFGNEDQTPRFIEQGVWENGYQDKYLDLVKSVQPGDHIAIKSSYTRKKGVPFDNRGKTVSVMAIKATGIVIENPGDGRKLKVNWVPVEPLREWYFYTGLTTIWRVLPGDWKSDALIAFTFDEVQQDIDRFRNAPFWLERFGDNPSKTSQFEWTTFYENVANKLLEFKDRRSELVAGIHTLASKLEGAPNFQDKYGDDTTGPLKDICPFTVMGIFNRGNKDSNRTAIAQAVADFLGVIEPAPVSFDAIPTLDPRKSWFFGYEKDRNPDDIDVLWGVFASAISFADASTPDARDEFVSNYDTAAGRRGVGWNLTMGLYWIRPWSFATLESQSQNYITSRLGIEIDRNGPKGRCSANDYLAVLNTLETRFQEEAYPVHSFPELSLLAPQHRPNENQSRWKKSVLARIRQLCVEKGSPEFSRKEFQENFLASLSQEFPDSNTAEFSIDRQMQILRDEEQIEFVTRGIYRWLGFGEIPTPEDDFAPPTEDTAPELPIVPYSVDDIIADGSFLARPRLAVILERLRTKKNIILQGPPGTGKTWLAKRLAFALVGARDDAKVRAVQFHPNLSYEDFVRGWRPAGDGKLTLVDGPFLEMVKAAGKDPKARHVVVIEEINRGNPAQILGEMLTLLEADKRTPNEALELCYRRTDDERIFIPDNLYVIGTMNIADRSLALVDLALRRRFAFIDLEPALGKVWHDWVHKTCAIDSAILMDIEARVSSLNETIAADTSLGRQYRVGHSYVTPHLGNPINDAREWFRQVVLTEIGPLLDEYWFDAPKISEKARQQLLEGF